ncbi:N-methyl-L-tryptophan oxidase [Pseudogracilibacillus sp. SO30301A]|uniref:N-methyl-L-tryptophan oxidase n=1 Tax=Pseudogracilibacillus sp. SO30301A TaxID=3098291 RepID=UPI00300E51D4
MTWDIGIIGLGTMGSMAMWQLAKQNVSIIGFEQYGIGHDRSAAGGESRLFRTAYKEGEQYVPLLKESKLLWRELEKETGNKLLSLSGGLTIGNPDDDIMKNVIKSAKHYDIEHEILDYNDAKKRYPQHLIDRNEIMVLDKEAGFLRPEYAVVSAVERAKELGATVNSYTPVTNVEQDGEKVIIQTREKEYKVNQVLIATGPWIRELIPEFSPIVEAKKIILSWFAPHNAEDFLPKMFPIFTRTSGEYKFYGGPTVENSMVKVGVSNSIPLGDAKNINRTVEPEEICENVMIIKKFFNGLYPDPVRVNAYMDAYTIDNHSLVGRIPNFPNAIVVGGFSGHGFKMAPAIGKIAKDILLNQKNNFDINALSPLRFQKK